MEIYWLHAALGAMVVLGVYNVVVKRFLTSEDWRVLLPLITIVALALTVYFVMNYKEVRFTGVSWPYALALGVVFGAAIVLSFIAIRDGPLSVVIPIISMSTAVTVVVGILFLGEHLSVARGAGIVLGLVSIYLLAS
ncbi:MAG: EamA family transporter [Candidatus Micrarchaeota archaeon]